jgi:hypothetical protein
MSVIQASVRTFASGFICWGRLGLYVCRIARCSHCRGSDTTGRRRYLIVKPQLYVMVGWVWPRGDSNRE